MAVFTPSMRRFTSSMWALVEYVPTPSVPMTAPTAATIGNPVGQDMPRDYHDPSRAIRFVHGLAGGRECGRRQPSAGSSPGLDWCGLFAGGGEILR